MAEAKNTPQTVELITTRLSKTMQLKILLLVMKENHSIAAGKCRERALSLK